MSLPPYQLFVTGELLNWNNPNFSDLTSLQPCQSWYQDLEEELSLALDVLLLGGVGVADHAHGALPLLPARPVETCLPLLCQYCRVLLLAPHAEAVYSHGLTKTTNSGH